MKLQYMGYVSSKSRMTYQDRDGEIDAKCKTDDIYFNMRNRQQSEL